MFRSKNRFQNSIQSCKRLFHKLGVAVALSSTLAGCPSVRDVHIEPEPKHFTKQKEVIYDGSKLFWDCYCDKDDNIKIKTEYSCRISYASYIVGFSPISELDQSIVDFCVSAILRAKETTPIKDVVSRTQPDKK